MLSKKMDVSLLHVEDDAAARDYFRDAVKPYVKRLYSARDGAMGLESFKLHNPDIVVTDVNMPELNGIDMAREIKLMRNSARVIFYSFMEKRAYLHEAINIGADAYIIKNFNNSYELLHSIGRAAERVTLEREVRKQSEFISKLSSAIEQIGSYVLVTDPHGYVEYANTKALELLGGEPSDALGKHLLKLPREGFAPVWEEAKSGKQIVAIYKAFTPVGGALWMRGSLSPCFDENGKIQNFTEVAEDITAMKLHEEQLDRAREEALDADRAKSIFLSNISHELRTPLNGIIGMSSLLLDSKLDSEQAEYVDMLKNSANSLLKIINNVLEITRIESGRETLHIKTFKLGSMLSSLINFFGVAIKEKDLDFSLEIAEGTPTAFSSDEGKLREILTHLLSNAIKFTDRGTIKLKVSSKPISANFCDTFFRVEDTGIGVPEDARRIIFDRFTQADGSYTRKYGGMGLGLAVSKEIAKLFEGELTCESKQGVGSAFTLRAKLKVARVEDVKEEPQPSLKAEASQPGSKYKILLVEDNSINKRIVLDFLTKNGHETHCASDGVEAIDAYLADDFDAVLMDIEMPRMNGFESTQRIRNIEKQADRFTPIIALTALNTHEVRQKCLRAGMDDFIAKPIDFSALISAIDAAVADSAMAKRIINKTEKIEG
ncbi:MAG: response regulator [Chloroflexota bacterium]